MRGTGVLTGATTTSLAQGPLIDTAEVLIQLSAARPSSLFRMPREVRYTRDGAFQTSELNGQHYLVNAMASLYLIRICSRLHQDIVINLTISTNGQITNNGEDLGQLGLFNFTNPLVWMLPAAETGRSQKHQGRRRQQSLSGQTGCDRGIKCRSCRGDDSADRSSESLYILSRAITTTDNMRRHRQRHPQIIIITGHQG